MPAPKAPVFETTLREDDRFVGGPYGMPLAYRTEEAEDEFGKYQRMVEVDPERMQSGNLDDSPDDRPDAAPGNRRPVTYP
jgi:hypothetical protein